MGKAVDRLLEKVGKLNRFADQDDVKKITRVINGGLNGLADRNAILEKAKRLLGAEFAPELLEQATHGVTQRI